MGCLCNSSETQNSDLQLIDSKTKENRATSGIISTKAANTPNNKKGKLKDQTGVWEDAEPSPVKEKPVSRVITRKSTIKGLAGTEFKCKLFDYLNEIRTNPREFAQVIDKYIPYITKGQHGSVLDKPGSTTSPIPLLKGTNAYRECKYFLLEQYPENPLSYREELELAIPQNPESWIKRQEITTISEKKRIELGDKYSFFTVNFDINSKDPELCAVNQIVDDSHLKGQRRNNILSNKLKYVGISNSQEIDKQCVVYVTFAY